MAFVACAIGLDTAVSSPGGFPFGIDSTGLALPQNQADISNDAMSGVFAGQQWTQASGSTWSVLIEPDFVNEVAELCNHLALGSQDARSRSESIVTEAQAASGDSGSQDARRSVVQKVIEAASSGLNQGAEARDLEGFTNLAVSLVNSTFESKDAEQYLVKLAKGIEASPSNESSSIVSARYSALSSLFNSLPESASYETRAAILLSLFQLAVSKDDFGVLAPALASLPAWISSEWNVTDSSAQDQIMASFVQALDKSSSSEKGEPIRSLLQPYANENTSDDLKAKLLLYTLASSNVFEIESLPKVSSDATLAKLREVFLTGTVQDLSNLAGSLPAPLEKEKVEEKLHYAVLADYCSKKVGQTVSYDEVAEVLGLAGSSDVEDRAMEVESWVIATIKVGLLAARLHQPSASVSILRASPRQFGSAEWKTLQSRLESWGSHLNQILDTVGRAVGPGSARPEMTASSAPSQSQPASNPSAAIEVA